MLRYLVHPSECNLAPSEIGNRPVALASRYGIGLKGEDPLEWPCLLTGAWTANLIIFSIATVAYYRPIRIGATFLLTAAILLSVWVFLLVVSTVTYFWAERKWNSKLAELAEAEAALAKAQADLARARAEGV